MNYQAMPHTDNCLDCKHWPDEWKKMIDKRQMDPGSVWRNKTTGIIVRNLKKPEGHRVGHESISGSKFYWSVCDRMAVNHYYSRYSTQDYIRLTIFHWWLAKLVYKVNRWLGRGKQ